MRAGLRQRRQDEEEESVFISMTDMTVGFLFIVILLLAFFATQIAPPGKVVPKQQLDERDRQIARLEERLLVFERPEAADLATTLEKLDKIDSQRRAAEAELTRLNATLAALRSELGIGPSDDLVAKVLELRAEIARLHELLQKTQVRNPIAGYNAIAATERAELLRRIKDRIVAANASIEVSLSEHSDALQFRGDGLFASGATSPSVAGRSKMETIAAIIAEEIGCFTFSSGRAPEATCNPNAVLIDAIQIEGHTDSQGGDIYNMTLGAERGASVFGVMVRESPNLLDFDNLQGQPVLSVAGYGEGRPIADEVESSGRDANRRIDIRFLMFAPTSEETIPRGLEDLGRIRKLLGGGGPE